MGNWKVILVISYKEENKIKLTYFNVGKGANALRMTWHVFSQGSGSKGHGGGRSS